MATETGAPPASGGIDAGGVGTDVPAARRVTRDDILRATAELIAESGILSATTRAIAERARCSEGSIYRYFPDKHALLHAVMFDQFESFFVTIEELPERAGRGSIRENLEGVAREAVNFYRGIATMVGAQLSDQKLMEEQRAVWEHSGGGPLRALNAVRRYVAAEQRLGRIEPNAEPDMVGRQVLGTCFANALLVALVGPGGRAVDRRGRTLDDERYVRLLVGSVLRGAGLTPSGRASG
ncbi:MAG: TetR/AcrR family transcriptional regulator [Actinomycetota bacterium]